MGEAQKLDVPVYDFFYASCDFLTLNERKEQKKECRQQTVDCRCRIESYVAQKGHGSWATLLALLA